MTDTAIIDRFTSHRSRLLTLLVGYGISVAVITAAMVTGYNEQVDRRLDQRTREVAVAYQSVISTVAAAPELLHAQLAHDPVVSEIMAAADGADEAELDALRNQLFTYLRDDYEVLRRLDFRQIHFHLRDNRSFLRFHRPDRFGDDLTAARATVRRTNSTQVPTYGFEMGRVNDGFRYVYPLFHKGRHVGSVEASMNYKAILSRMRSSNPVVFDFLLDRRIVQRKVFNNEIENYATSGLSNRFLRERGFDFPDTGATLGVDYSRIVDAGGSVDALSNDLASYTATTVPFFVASVPVSVSILPIQNVAGENVAVILGYSRIDEIVFLRRLFFIIGASIVALSTAVFALFFWITHQRERVLEVGRDLRRTIEAKDRFFSIVSHDLRGPIGSMASLGNMLKTELNDMSNIPEGTREMADVLADGAENSAQLLNDLLDWSRSQRGDITYTPQYVDLHTVVETQLTALQRAAAEKQISLENRVDIDKRRAEQPGAGQQSAHQVIADEYMLKTIVRNLVSNGIKFTPEGGTVSVGSEDRSDGVEILVTDTGVGMTEEQRTALFDLSTKSSTHGTRGERGTGLGLTVCLEFVHAHKGTLEVSSTVNAGTTFTVFLPSVAE